MEINCKENNKTYELYLLIRDYTIDERRKELEGDDYNLTNWVVTGYYPDGRPDYEILYEGDYLTDETRELIIEYDEDNDVYIVDKVADLNKIISELTEYATTNNGKFEYWEN